MEKWATFLAYYAFLLQRKILCIKETSKMEKKRKEKSEENVRLSFKK